MTTRDLFERLQALPRPDPAVLQVPPIELVAVLVGIQRRVLGLKQTALADFAGVSLSTVERLERGESISEDAIEKISVGLGLEPGHYTALRRPRSDSELAQEPPDGWPDLIAIDVAQPRSQAALRKLAQCSAMVVFAPNVPEADVHLLKELAERIDLLGYVLAAHLIVEGGRKEGGRRDVYQAVLDQLDVVRSAGYCVLAGVTNRPSPTGDEPIAFFAVSPRASDPGAVSRRKVFLDRRALSSPHRALLDG